jgi:large subunit ribosomal protein L13
MQRQTTIAKAQQIERKWYVVDANGLTLGRLASVIAKYLTGKNKAIYTPNVDCGDYIIVVNAEKVALSGDADHKKNYYNVSQYLGGLRTRSSGTMRKQYPEEMIERAVWGMLPKGRLGRQIYKKLFVYAGPEHLHEAQKPEELKLKY